MSYPTFPVLPLGRYMRTKTVEDTLAKSKEFFSSDMGAVLVNFRPTNSYTYEPIQVVIFTSGNAANFAKNHKMNETGRLQHDQTQRDLGHYELLGTYQIVDGKLVDPTGNIQRNTIVKKVFTFK